MLKKIAILHPHVAIKGGAVKTLLYVANFLQEENEVHFFTLEKNTNICFPELSEKINIITPVFLKTPVLKLLNLLIISWQIRKYDVIIAGNSPMHFVSVLAKIFNTGVEMKIFRFIQNIPFYYVSDTNTGVLRNTGVKVKKFLEKFSIKYIDTIISNSSFIQSKIKEIFGINSQIIYPPVDTDFFQTSRNDETIQKILHRHSELVSESKMDAEINSAGRSNPETLLLDCHEVFQTSRNDETIQKIPHRHSELVSESKLDAEINSAGRNNNDEIKTKNIKTPVFLETPVLNKPILFTYSRLVKGKNIELAIKTFFTLSKKYPDLKLYIGGDGEEKLKLEKLASNNPDIIFLGELSQTQIREYLTISTIFLFTSLIDAFGLSITEAMSVGVPVVSLDIGGAPDIINSGVNGFLANYENEFIEKVENILQNKNIYDIISLASRNKIINNFSLHSFKEKIKKLF